MELKIFELVPGLKKRDRCAVIIHYAERPPDDPSGTKRKEIERLVATKFVVCTLFSLMSSATVGVFVAIVLSEVFLPFLGAREIAPDWKISSFLVAAIFWIRYAPPMFGEALRELIQDIELYAAKDGYFHDEIGQPIS